jgi:hypothetical protein
MNTQLLNLQTGGKQVRPNNWWSQSGAGTPTIRPPKNLSLNENNVALPSAVPIVALAAGASAVLTMTAQRDCIVRELILDAYDAAPAVGSGREGNIGVTALTVAGENCFAGNGEMPGRTFFADSFDRPEFDMPVKGGTAVVVTVVNRSASAAGTDISGGCKVD